MSERRRLCEEDADAVAALFLEAWGASRRMNGNEIREWIANESLKPENLLVLEDAGRVVGYFDVWPEGDVADVDVAAPGFWDEWRRRGIGEALLRRSFQALHGRGRRRVRLPVDAENLTGATRLYERAGMAVIRQSHTWERVI